MNERHDTGKKGKEDDSNLEEIQKYIQSNPDAIPRLKEIKKESIGLKGDHFEIWAGLLGNDCPIEELELLSPENMEKEGHFLQWHDNNGMDIFGEQ
ncbi:hypothetical protein BASA50_004060 [Batrachochytrium salamandrivorans]|uniref:Uncharacterized protein n=1 Tax=Batrachochytrium salamandrivorans TaxID=1357716 RepID=A0ABQ8FGN9_9FUNG|nr:hypothetical protein BASA50_004060 [Batrachochytrium salamandrivorans]